MRESGVEEACGGEVVWGEGDRSSRVVVLVSSSDHFFDCWVPFFYLWERYWPGCRYPVFLLNNAIPIDAGRVGQFRVSPDRGWSGNLMRFLRWSGAEQVIYLHEDHFLSGPVREEGVEADLRLMREMPLDFVAYRVSGKKDGVDVAGRPELVLHRADGGRGLNTEPGIWRREVLLALLREEENAWQFLASVRPRAAAMGVRRAQYLKECAGRLPLPFLTRSGVREGLWLVEALEFLEREGVPVRRRWRGRMFQSYELQRRALKRPGDWRLRMRQTGWGLYPLLEDWQRRWYRPRRSAEVERLARDGYAVNAAVRGLLSGGGGFGGA